LDGWVVDERTRQQGEGGVEEENKQGEEGGSGGGKVPTEQQNRTTRYGRAASDSRTRRVFVV